MRRYCQFGGGTLSTHKPISGGMFLRPHIEKFRYNYTDVQERFHTTSDKYIQWDGQVSLYNEWFGDLGGTAASMKVVNNNPNSGKTGYDDDGDALMVRVTKKHKGWVKGEEEEQEIEWKMPHKVVISAGWAMTDGWMNNDGFIKNIPHLIKVNNVQFSEETRWRYGAFPFTSVWFQDEARNTMLVDLLKIRLPGLDTVRLQTPLTNEYFDAYHIVRGQDPRAAKTHRQLPARQDWFDHESGAAHQGAFVSGSLVNFDPEANKPERDGDLTKMWGPPHWIPQDQQYSLAADERGLQQPGSRKGALPTDMSGVNQPLDRAEDFPLFVQLEEREAVMMGAPQAREDQEFEEHRMPRASRAASRERESYKLVELRRELATHLENVERGDSGIYVNDRDGATIADQIRRAIQQEQRGSVNIALNMPRHVPMPEKDSISMGPLSFSGQGAWMIGLVFLALLLFFLFR